MILIPAIDIKDGRCVRLRQGRMDDVTVFSDDPVAMASRWVALGCRRLHLVDLDGAVAGVPKNRALIERIVAAAGQVPVQVGGGIRNAGTIDAYLDAGSSQVIIGTRAVAEPALLEREAPRHPGRLILGLDARDGFVATDGWGETSAVRAGDLMQRFAGLPLAAVVYTDIARDGMMRGVNVEATIALATATDLPVVASGGLSRQQDLERLVAAAAAAGVTLGGAITGRALYEGTLDLPRAQRWLDAQAHGAAAGP